MSAAKGLGLFVGGMAVGYLLTLRLRPADDSSCCKRVAAGVRDTVHEKAGGIGVFLGDLFGVWDRSPSILDALGVPDDYVG